MLTPNFVIRTMSREDIDIAIEWAAEEGWNPGLHDADCFYAADNNGFLIGELNREPIATISAVKYGEYFGFMGFYIVKPSYRGKGFGIQIWNAALKYLSGRNIGLDGVVEQQSNYRKSGFKLAYSNIRYEGITVDNSYNHPNIVTLNVEFLDQVEKYDKQFFPDKRSKFLEAWLNQPESASLGIIQNGKLSGYGVIRICRTGYKIGPLFADTPESAESLFVSLNSKVEPGRPIFLDIPENNIAAFSLVKKHNMKLVFETARMYTGEFPNLPIKNIFGVTTFELG